MLPYQTLILDTMNCFTPITTKPPPGMIRLRRFVVGHGLTPP